MAEWLKLGIIQPAWSKFNSPIFAVARRMAGSDWFKIFET
jgi:hypothetical protein